MWGDGVERDDACGRVREQELDAVGVLPGCCATLRDVVGGHGEGAPRGGVLVQRHDGGDELYRSMFIDMC